MYGRADGMPSFQLTVAVRAVNASCAVYLPVKSGLASNDETEQIDDLPLVETFEMDSDLFMAMKMS